MNVTTTEHVGRVFRDVAGGGTPVPWRHTIFGIPTLAIWNLLVILLLVLVLYWLIRGSRKSHETPMDLLKKRYVRGEIDKRTFLEIKEDIAD